MGSPAIDDVTADEVAAVDDLPDPPDDSIVGTPARRPGSIRRTSHINMVWPAGLGTPLHLLGRARDLLTRTSGSPEVLAEAEIRIEVGEDRTVDAISVTPVREGIEALTGARGGGRFRAAIDAALPGEREMATPLYFLLDDVAGATLIAGFAWSPSRRLVPLSGQQTEGVRRAGPGGRIICSGLRPSGYHDVQRERGNPFPQMVRRAGDLSNPDDPWAWHPIEPAPAVCMRRRRRIDAWLSGSEIEVDAHFRDSMWDPDHVELAVHEYTLRASIHADSGVLREVEAIPRVLPFPECPWAAPHASTLESLRVDSFRTRVQDNLTELRCCTHLNDMMRGLAEVPALASALGR